MVEVKIPFLRVVLTTLTIIGALATLLGCVIAFLALMKPEEARRILIEFRCPATPTPVIIRATVPISQITTPMPTGGEVQPPTPLSQIVPGGVSLRCGDTFKLPPDRWWICMVDFTISRRDGAPIPLHYPGEQERGLIFVIEQGNTFTIGAPCGGYCEPLPSSQEERAKIVWAKIGELFTHGCVTGTEGCEVVEVIELDKEGNTQKNYMVMK